MFFFTIKSYLVNVISIVFTKLVFGKQNFSKNKYKSCCQKYNFSKNWSLISLVKGIKCARA